MLTIARHLPGQWRALFVPREELEGRRDRAVRETVLYAAGHVPHYRDLFRHEGIDPREIRGADDLARLPTLTREDVLRDPARFRSDAREARDGVTLQSSGTTGESLSLFHDRRSVLLNVAYSERERAVETAFVGKRLRYTRLFLSPDTVENVNRVRGLAARESFRPFRPRYRQEHGNRPRDELVQLIERIRPDALAGSGSVLEAFFRVAAERGAPRHLPRVVIYAWDAMTAAGRELIERTFGIPVLSRYSAMECLKIGFFCERRERLSPARGPVSRPCRERRAAALQPLQPRLRAPQLPDRRSRDAVGRALPLRAKRAPARRPGRPRQRSHRAPRRLDRRRHGHLGRRRQGARRPALPGRAACAHGVRSRAVYGRAGRLRAGGGAGGRRRCGHCSEAAR